MSDGSTVLCLVLWPALPVTGTIRVRNRAIAECPGSKRLAISARYTYSRLGDSRAQQILAVTCPAPQPAIDDVARTESLTPSRQVLPTLKGIPFGMYQPANLRAVGGLRPGQRRHLAAPVDVSKSASSSLSVDDIVNFVCQGQPSFDETRQLVNPARR